MSANLGVPDISKTNAASNYFDASTLSVSFKTIVDAGELDLTEVFVRGKINGNQVEGYFNL